MLLTLNQGIKEMQRTIQETLGNIKTKVLSGGRTKILHIRDIDSITSGEEVREAILRKCQVKNKEKLVVKPLSPARNGNQVATVIVEEDDATAIAQTGKIRVGLSLCRIQKRIDLDMCYKCWAYGHKAAKYQGNDRTELCKSCAKGGHKKETCNLDPYCPLCEKQGHEAGNKTCEAFRIALAAVIKRGYQETNSL
ncbi:hypothetical protein Zmor_003624 [Zophobas morio]|uniref:Gag-like protein n=1 Tax=Zophobas morio TaxID=2755281 RepID=A0AA38HNP6_9CUCU|nr:hypothetical protein Zmor_003624 [Zophobas morio]